MALRRRDGWQAQKQRGETDCPDDGAFHWCSNPAGTTFALPALPLMRALTGSAAFGWVPPGRPRPDPPLRRDGPARNPRATPPPGSTWYLDDHLQDQIVGAGDYDGDTKADILWRNVANGEVWASLMDGTTRRSENYVDTVPDLGYQVVTMK